MTPTRPSRPSITSRTSSSSSRGAHWALSGDPPLRRGRSSSPAAAYADYLAAAVGPIRRYGAAEPTVVVALLQLMTLSADAARSRRQVRREAIRGEAALLLEDAERRTENPADLRTVHAAYARLELALAS